MAIASKEYGPSVTTYPFPLEGMVSGETPAGGGLQTVFSDELTRRSEQTPEHQLIIISNDDKKIIVPSANAQLWGGDPATPFPIPLYDVWFSDEWTMIHPDAFSDKGQPSDVLSAMYQGNAYTTPLGSTARIEEHHEKFGLNNQLPQAKEQFTNRFQKAIEAIPENAVVHWQDFFWIPLMEKNADALRANGAFQTYHHHMSFPEQFSQFPWGQQVLTGISKMDEIYVHTDIEVSRVQTQLEALGLPVPQVKRFDLGIDIDPLKIGLDEVTKFNYRARPEYQSLPLNQKATLDEIYQSQDTIPHRFIDIGRLDPQKGTGILLDGIDSYLSSLDMSMDDMKETFRFFFIMEFKQLPSAFDADNLKHQYNKYVNEKLKRMEEKYPGVIYSSASVPRPLVPSMLKGAHTMTGGIQDGLNLAIQEGLAVNALAGEDVNGIAGMGTGFAMQTMQDETHRDLVHFVRVGNKDDVASAIRDTVHVAENFPGELARRTKAVHEQVISQRGGTIFVRPQ